MKKTSGKQGIALSTEEKIKAAARKVFMQKGYGAARTRDIAAAAGINLALLNYYFRSKEKLFHETMVERIQQLFGTILPILNNSNTSIEEKIELFTNRYMDILIENPDLPMFVFNEIRKHPDLLKKQLRNNPTLVMNSVFLRQLKARRKDIDPIQFLMSIIGMTLFPFIAKPILITNAISEKDFIKLMHQRRKLIPKWTKAILQTK